MKREEHIARRAHPGSYRRGGPLRALRVCALPAEAGFYSKKCSANSYNLRVRRTCFMIVHYAAGRGHTRRARRAPPLRANQGLYKLKLYNEEKILTLTVLPHIDLEVFPWTRTKPFSSRMSALI